MFAVQTALTALLALAVLFAITKAIGHRQLAQLSTFDYINGITIGSIGAELAVAEGQEFWKWLVALLVFGVATWILAVLPNRSLPLRRFLNGRASILLDNGRLYDKNFKRAHMDIHEFLMECRNQGYFDLSQIQTAVLEANGSISILPVSRYRPATPEDLALSVSQETACGNVILDGVLMERNLQNMGFDRAWLDKQLARQHVRITDIFLAICSADGSLTAFPYTHKDHRDIWE